jgi:multidrug transporter EmrE-like cation transporter
VGNGVNLETNLEATLSAAVTDPKQISEKPSRRQPVGLVFCCTILGAAAQVLMKTGANHMAQRPGLLGMATNLPLMGGYCLYGLSTLLLVLALKDGELSLLYPVIALTYVWVTVLSFLIFHDGINPWKLAGIVLIVSGVTVLGKGGKR